MGGMKWLGIEIVEVSPAEKIVSALGSTLAIFCLFWISRFFLPADAVWGVLGSMGATAVLLFAVPHGPLSQPWPLLVGHTISAVIGVCCAKAISDPFLATAMAVGGSIAAMHQLKCIHPPGGATAFTAVMGGQGIRDLGFGYVLCPVLLNTVAMLVLAIVINYFFAWRRYPAGIHRRAGGEIAGPGKGPDEMHQKVIAAIRSLDSFVDIDEEDLVYLAQGIVQSISGKQSPPGELVLPRESRREISD